MTEGCHAGFLCFCFVFTDGLVSQPQPPSCNHHHELVINLGKRRYMLQPNLLKGPICFTLKNPTRVFSMQQHVVIIITLLHPWVWVQTGSKGCLAMVDVKEWHCLKLPRRVFTKIFICHYVMIGCPTYRASHNNSLFCSTTQAIKKRFSDLGTPLWWHNNFFTVIQSSKLDFSDTEWIEKKSKSREKSSS